MYKVWYRNNGQLEVDVIADNTSALRRAASFASSPGDALVFVGIEDDDGQLMGKADFDRYLKGYQARGLDDEPAVCPKYYVEVEVPDALRGADDDDEWVRVAIEQTKVAATNRLRSAEEAFGHGRARITPVVARMVRA